jgi:hypothetical protein
MVESNDLSDEDPILKYLKDELDDTSLEGAEIDDEMEEVAGFTNFNMNLSENCQIIIIVLLLIILFKEEIMKTKIVKSILN